MSDDFRDSKGRLKPGAPPLFKGNQGKQQPQSDTPPFDGDFDDAVIFIAETYGTGKPRPTVGLLAVVEDLRRNKSTDFASYLRQAYANRKQRQSVIGSGGPSVHVSFTTAPSGMCVDANGQLVEAPDARAEWERKNGMVITDDASPPSPPPATKPVLVHPRDDDDEPRADNEVEFGGSDDDTPEPTPPRHRDRGIDLNDMLRAFPKPK